MKFVKSELIQKVGMRKRGKYLITLEVTDYDLDRMEDLVTCDLGWLEIHDPKEYNRLMKWSRKMWITFWKLWHIYDS